MSTLYSFSRAAARLGIDRKRIGRWAKSGQIRVVELENQRKISIHEIERIEREGVRPLGKPRRRAKPAPDVSGEDVMGIEI